MIKRTVAFGNPVYLSHRNHQMVVQFPDGQPERTLPVEDLGFVLLENPQITISLRLLSALAENNTAVICCDEKHMPSGIMQPYEGHSEQNQRYRIQAESSLPLKKNLWQQVIKSKIENQATLLKNLGHPYENMLHWASEVNSGDTQNHEGRAAAYYWGILGENWNGFTRGRNGAPPNHWLNYGYALIRAAMTRAVAGAGLMPTMGIHHQNKYNAFCLADDLMEPYRVWIDRIVIKMVKLYGLTEDLTPDAKKELLQVLALDVSIEGQVSPLMIAVTRTVNSLVDCFEGNTRKLILPEFNG